MGIAEEENENEKEDEIVVEENENVENIAKETSDDDSANESMEEDEVSQLSLQLPIVWMFQARMNCLAAW